jgi:hypothetical protein
MASLLFCREPALTLNSSSLGKVLGYSLLPVRVDGEGSVIDILFLLSY